MGPAEAAEKKAEAARTVAVNWQRILKTGVERSALIGWMNNEIIQRLASEWM